MRGSKPGSAVQSRVGGALLQYEYLLHRNSLWIGKVTGSREMLAYERISSELRPRSFGLPLSPTPSEAPTPTPLSISGLQSDGGSLQTEPRLQPCATYSPRWSFCQSVDRRRRGRDRRCGRPCCRAAARPAASRAPSSPADRTPAAARRSGRPSEMAMLSGQREAKREEEKCLTSSVEVSDLNVQQQASGSVSTPS